MALLSKRARLNDVIPTSSMADVAFLLLVFFLVTTVFPKDKGLALVLPDEIGEVSPGNILHLWIASSGSIEVRFGDVPRRRQVGADEVAALWRQGASQNPALIAALKTSPDAAYRYMVEVLDQLQLAGASRISLQLLPQ